MKLTINADLFKSMVAKAVKGSASTSLYITQLMAISLKDNELTLITTDGNNYLYVKEAKVAGDDFYVVVPVDRFSKLVSKFTCAKITLDVSSSGSDLDKLIVRGNGVYVIELPYDENGQLVRFPDPISQGIEDSVHGTVKLSTIHLILSTAKAALKLAKVRDEYCGYYVGDKIVTTDTYKICGIDIKMFDRPMLLPPELVDLLDTLDEEDVSVEYNDDTLIFSTSRTIVYGHTMENIDDYNIQAISSLLDEPFGSSCKVDKSMVLQLLERLALFVSPYDDHVIRLIFTRDGITMSSKQDTGSELIPYKDSVNFKEYSCFINIELLKSQVRANPSGIIEVLYGNDSAIKLVNDHIKQIVALSEEVSPDNSEQTESEQTDSVPFD